MENCLGGTDGNPFYLAVGMMRKNYLHWMGCKLQFQYHFPPYVPQSTSSLFIIRTETFWILIHVPVLLGSQDFLVGGFGVLWDETPNIMFLNFVKVVKIPK